MCSRLIHELVHGVYGVSDHYQEFASTQTSLVAALGDKIADIIDAGLEAATGEASVRVKKEIRDGKEVVVSTRAAPKKAEVVEGRDARLPTVGTVLSKDGLTLVVLDKGFLIIRMRRGQDDLGYYPSLSAAVKHHLNQSTYNGYLYFKLMQPWDARAADKDIYLGEVPAEDIAILQDAVVNKPQWLSAWRQYVDLNYPMGIYRGY
jgi:hypothetical protein